MKCDEMKGLYAEALYGELQEVRMAEFNTHLAACGSCAREYDGMRQTLAMMGRRERVEPTEAEWAEYSKALDAKLKSELALKPTDGRPAGEKRPNIIPWLPTLRPAWGYGIAALLLVAFGIYMGRTLFNGGPGGSNGAGPGEALSDARSGASSAESPADETNRDALAYLERSRNLLLGFTNIDEKQAGSIDINRSRKVSRELYNKGNTLTVALNRPSQQQLRQLVQGLQIILLQLSNMDAGNGTPVIEMIRKGVDSKSILLKINLEAIRAALAEDGNKHSL